MSMHRSVTLSVLFLVVALFAPYVTQAALNAGVVDGVWFSSTTPTEGEEVRIYTAIQNQSDETITGTVAFLVNGDIVGTAPFTVVRNDIIRVSTPYTFTGGEYDVSAYITSAQENNVAYTTVSKTPVSVTKTKTATERKLSLDAAPPVVADTADTVLTKSTEVLASVAPAVETAAEKIESFRDTFTTPTSTSTATVSLLETSSSAHAEVPPSPSASPSVSSAKVAATTLVHDTKELFAIDGLALWKKALGAVLSFFAFVLRLWYVVVLLLFFYIFWRLVRGRRIR